MKTRILGIALALASLTSLVQAGITPTFTFSSTAINDANQVILPAGMVSVVKAVNVGSTTATTINGITFEADVGFTPDPVLRNYNGNGYTARAASEIGVSPVSNIPFSGTTINVLDDFIHGTNFTGLSTNTDYVFQVFLSDFNSGRGSHFSYTLGSTSETTNISQTLGNLNRYQVQFNTGTDTTFGWALDSEITVIGHAKLSGFVLYSASASAVPEPSTYAAIFGAVVLGVAVYRRRSVRA